MFHCYHLKDFTFTLNFIFAENNGDSNESKFHSNSTGNLKFNKVSRFASNSNFRQILYLRQIHEVSWIRILDHLPLKEFLQSRLVSRHLLRLSHFALEHQTSLDETHKKPFGFGAESPITLTAREVAHRLRAEFDLNDLNAVSELCEQFPNLSTTSRTPSWYYFVVRVGEWMYNERLCDQVPQGFVKRTAKGISFSRKYIRTQLCVFYFGKGLRVDWNFWNFENFLVGFEKSLKCGKMLV